MLKHSIQSWGAQYILTIEGQPAELSTTLNHYCNYGMFRGDAIPANYDETKHSRVVLNVTKERVMPALVAIEQAALARSPECKALKGKPGTVFQSIAHARAEGLFSTFVRENLAVIADDQENADLRDYTIDEDELDGISARELKRRGRAILREWSGAKRDSASPAGKSSAE